MKNRAFADRGFRRLMDAYEGAPRGSLRLTQDTCEVLRNLDLLAGKDPTAAMVLSVDVKSLLEKFKGVIDDPIEGDAANDYERLVEDIEWTCRNAARMLTRIRTTARKVALFRQTGKVR